MDAKYGIFPKVVAIVSGILAAFICLTAIISNFFVGSFIVTPVIALLWGVLLKLLTFGFEPQYFKKLDGSEERAPKGDFKIQDLIDTIENLPKVDREVSKDRILGQANRSPVANARLIGVSPARSSEEIEQRKEDQAWAEMFRAL